MDPAALAAPSVSGVNIDIAGCRVTIDDDAKTVTTTFPDGIQLVAAPRMDSESVARARTLGYQGSDEEAVWAMCRDHDVLHTLLADAQGWDRSATLYGVAAGHPCDRRLASVEEAIVLLMQRLANVGVAGVLPAPPTVATRGA